MKYSGVRNRNLSVILKAVKRNPVVNRTQLAKMTGLTKTTISSTINELMDFDLIRVEGEGGASSKGGRKPVLLSLKEDSYKAIGIDIRREKLIVVLVDLGGNVIHSNSLMIPPHPEKKSILSLIRETLQNYVEIAGEKILGIGLGVPGPLDLVEKKILNPIDFDCLRDTPIKDIVYDWFGLPTFVETGSDCGAMSEYYQKNSVRQLVGLLVFVEVDYGLGFTLMNQGKIIQGVTSAGEIGHIVINVDGKNCDCGRRGCLYDYASGEALLKTMRESGNIDEKQYESFGVFFENFVKEYNNGSELHGSIMEKTGYYMAVGIANIFNLFSPNILLIGSSLDGVADMYVKNIKACVDRLGGMEKNIGPRIFAAHYGPNAIAVGAAMLVLQDFLETPRTYLKKLQLNR